MRQLSAQQVASRCHISSSYLLKIEGDKRTPSPRVLVDLARVLRVGVEVLTGQPYYGDPEGEDQVQAVIPDLRRIMLTYDSPQDWEVAPRPVAILLAEVERVAEMRRATAFTGMGPLLAPLLTELTTVALSAREDSRERWAAFTGLARTYRAVNTLAHKLGHHDLSNTAIERVHWAADQSGDYLLQVVAAYLRAGAMLRQGAYGPGRRKLEGLRDELDRSTRGDFQRDDAAMDGSILLKLAMLEARSGRAEAAEEYLRDAQRYADYIGGDMMVRETSFGPAQVKIHRIAALLDIGDTEQAARLPAQWGREEGREEWAPPADLAPERSSHHYIDMGAVLLAENRPQDAERCLVQARALGPIHTRFHPRARNTVSTLLRTTAHPSRELAAMGTWMGQRVPEI